MHQKVAETCLFYLIDMFSDPGYVPNRKNLTFIATQIFAQSPFLVDSVIFELQKLMFFLHVAVNTV